MSDTDTQQLITEIETVSTTEFWWDSPLPTRAASVHDAGVVKALTLRHHALSNKEAYSAYVVRHAIRMSDGPRLPYLWAFIDAETDSKAIQERMDDFRSLPWAAAFIIGEIGGRLWKFTERITRDQPIIILTGFRSILTTPRISGCVRIGPAR